MEKSGYCSYKNGDLTRGCQLCVKGRKLVLFITGVCPRSCYFCPLSEQKFHKDVIYANERKIEDLNEIIEEAKLSCSYGCGITGGDPLAKFDRTIEVIKLLKKEFQKFHIHLYTSLNLVDEDKLRKLEESGLDEIRFHLDFDDEQYWEKIKLKTSMKKGMEIPCIPGKDVKKMIDYVKDYVEFINLNELEYADAEHNKLGDMGFELKDPLSCGIKGSEELAFEVMEAFPNLNIHYCTAKLKDSVQMMNRIANRAKNVKREFDIVNGALLTRGAIYGDEDLEVMKEKVSKWFKSEIDLKKKRLLCGRKSAKMFAEQLKKLGYRVEIVEELATYDQFEIESQEL
ncbi:MAG: radical SAM protein [Nanoarchaeota archaeon]|nr:radical SAM protein [Nanoarchaeota archaeon]